MLPGVHVETSKNQKDELQLTGNSLQSVSQSAADIQQICMVRNKDIRKVSWPVPKGIYFWDILGLYCVCSSWTVSTFRTGEILRTRHSRPMDDAILRANAAGKLFKTLDQFK